MSNIFTTQELQKIEQNCREYDYTTPNEYFFGWVSTDIIKQDTQTGLILPKGNDDTGYEHIIRRHFGSEMKFYWKEKNNTVTKSLDNPTIFKGDILPVTLIYYAKQIFCNSLIKNREEQSDFTVYEGNVNYGKSYEQVKSRLLTYNNTNVIHTFYISQLGICKNRNKNKKYYRGLFSLTEYPIKCIKEYYCDFFDFNKCKLFKYVQIEDHYNLSITIKIVIDNCDYFVHEELLDGNEISGVFKALGMDMKVNDDFEKQAIRKYESISQNKI